MSREPESKGGGLLGLLKSTFIREDEEDSPRTDGQAPPPVRAAPALQSHDQDLVRRIDEQAMARLQSPVEAVAGTYAEFMASMDALSEAIPDIASRQRAVIKLMTKKRIPLPKILSDLDACIGALEQEGRTFRSESEKHVEKKVGGLRQESEVTAAAIAAKEAQLAAAQADLVSLRAAKAAKDSEVRDAESHAALVQSRFTIVYNSTHAAMAAQRKQVSDLVDKESA